MRVGGGGCPFSAFGVNDREVTRGACLLYGGGRRGLSRPSGVVGGLGPFRPACLPQGYFFLFKFEFEIQIGVLNKRNFINQTKF